MTDNIVQLPAFDSMTVDQALDYAKNEGLTDVLIVGYDQDGDLVIRSSGMSRKDAHWLATKACDHALGR